MYPTGLKTEGVGRMKRGRLLRGEHKGEGRKKAEDKKRCLPTHPKGNCTATEKKYIAPSSRL